MFSVFYIINGIESFQSLIIEVLFDIILML